MAVLPASLRTECEIMFNRDEAAWGEDNADFWGTAKRAICDPSDA